MDAAWIRMRTDHPLADLMVPRYTTDALERSDVALARLRLCQTLTALRLGETPEAIDPFDGEPIRFSDTAVWSVGPDQRDQEAWLVYDPTNGTASMGDITARR